MYSQLAYISSMRKPYKVPAQEYSSCGKKLKKFSVKDDQVTSFDIVRMCVHMYVWLMFMDFGSVLAHA